MYNDQITQFLRNIILQLQKTIKTKNYSSTFKFYLLWACDRGNWFIASQYKAI